jgi:hypothetical protein
MSVSVKSPLIAIAAGVRATLPVFSSVTVCAGLAVPNTWLANVSEAGRAVAVVKPVFAVHNGVCQTPRP